MKRFALLIGLLAILLVFNVAQALEELRRAAAETGATERDG